MDSSRITDKSTLPRELGENLSKLESVENPVKLNGSSVFPSAVSCYINTDSITRKDRASEISLSQRSISGTWIASCTFEELFADAMRSGIRKEYAHAGLIYIKPVPSGLDNRSDINELIAQMDGDEISRQLKKIDREYNKMPEYYLRSDLQKKGIFNVWRLVSNYDNFICEVKNARELMKGSVSYIEFLGRYEAALEDRKQFKPREWLRTIVKALLNPGDRLAELCRIWTEYSHLTAVQKYIESDKWGDYCFRWSHFHDLGLLPSCLLKIPDSCKSTRQLRSDEFKPTVKTTVDETSGQNQKSARKRKKGSDGSSATTKRSVTKQRNVKNASIKDTCEEQSMGKLCITGKTLSSEISIPQALLAACTFEELFSYAKSKGISEEFVYAGYNLNHDQKKVGNNPITHNSFETMTESQNIEQWKRILKELSAMPVTDDLHSDLYDMDLDKIWREVVGYDEFIRNTNGVPELIKGTDCYLKFLGKYERNRKGNKFRPKRWLLTVAKAQQNSQNKLVQLCRIWTECSHLTAISEQIEMTADSGYKFDWSYLYKLLPGYSTSFISRETTCSQFNEKLIGHDSTFRNCTLNDQPDFDSAHKIDTQSSSEPAVMVSTEHSSENTVSAGQILNSQPVLAEADSTESMSLETDIYKVFEHEVNHHQTCSRNLTQVKPKFVSNESVETIQSAQIMQITQSGSGNEADFFWGDLLATSLVEEFKDIEHNPNVEVVASTSPLDGIIDDPFPNLPVDCCFE